MSHIEGRPIPKRRKGNRISNSDNYSLSIPVHYKLSLFTYEENEVTRLVKKRGRVRAYFCGPPNPVFCPWAFFSGFSVTNMTDTLSWSRCYLTTGKNLLCISPYHRAPTQCGELEINRKRNTLKTGMNSNNCREAHAVIESKGHRGGSSLHPVVRGAHLKLNLTPER